MDAVQALVLGIVQGLTEFVPISSSAHLVLVPYFLKWQNPTVAFDVMLHLGTLTSVVFYFREEILKLLKGFITNIWHLDINRDLYGKLAILILIGTIPAAVIIPLFKDFFEDLFSRPFYVSFFLIITGIVMILGEILFKQYSRKKKLEEIGFIDSLVVGFFQVAAVAPGVSRSGFTIAAGLFKGIDRKTAARFSFLLSIPVILGASVVKAIDLIKSEPGSFDIPMVIGFVTAAVSGFLAIKYLLRFLAKGKLNIFSYYCFIIGGLSLFMLIW